MALRYRKSPIDSAYRAFGLSIKLLLLDNFECLNRAAGSASSDVDAFGEVGYVETSGRASRFGECTAERNDVDVSLARRANVAAAKVCRPRVVSECNAAARRAVAYLICGESARRYVEVDVVRHDVAVEVVDGFVVDNCVGIVAVRIAESAFGYCPDFAQVLYCT